MAGEPIEAVRQGIKALLSELRGDPQALETAYLSVITFASRVQQTTKLTELMLFKEPRLEAEGCTLMGGALKLLAECVRTEVRKNTETQKGDWRPLVFLLTDGSPTDLPTGGSRNQVAEARQHHRLCGGGRCRYELSEAGHGQCADDEQPVRRRYGEVLCMGLRLDQDVLQEP